MKPTFLQLDADRIVQTVALLQRRVAERFPDSGLGRVAAELHGLAAESVQRIRAIRRRNW